MGGVSDEVLLARAYLSRVAEPASMPVWHLVHTHGPIEAAERIRAGQAPPKALQATQARARAIDPQSDLDAALRHGVRLVVPECAEWPHLGLGPLEKTAQRLSPAYEADKWSPDPSGDLVPPVALWVKGEADLRSLGVRSAGIVGSRAASEYGQRVASDLAYGLALADVAVISGGAYGIDAAAHRGALAAGGVTVLISAGGLDKAYPSANAQLYRRTAESGLLLSESPPGAAPQRHRFLSRNRLIASLSAGTVVVEAASRSGAKNTAKHCRALGRVLMAVPGPVSSPMSAGCHGLIRDASAILVCTLDDVLGVVGGLGETSDQSIGAADAPSPRNALFDKLDPTTRRVYDGLPARRVASVDEISVVSGLAVPEVLRSLPVLELAGLVEASPGGFKIRRERAPTQKRGSDNAST